ncbi:ABC transporter ATP-binding protein [Neolewinella lacunae]|uniref:ABC transporter ATP-binding protein n=1 Tax=Neolewinella lacunae TaxID=1517758 RepID=A0A923PN25_9BACT|nr:ABC transporter ATP-binding protein [Neolewinella lacunae]MBC6993547.1 ABC transporter ATP-binding protein [Neolewinella lacunae]MDN3636177.1 ABC transporter ATP-binding protein [Neolewinella lacunae]
MSPSPLLEVEQLTIAFGDAPPVVDHLSFQLAAGDRLGLLGLSGSGKSLSALALLGMLPAGARICGGSARYHLPAGGVVDLLTAPEATLRQLRGRDLSLVFQEPLTALNPVHRIEDQLVEAVSRLHPTLGNRSAKMDSVREWLHRVELSEDQERILRAYPHELSGGQRQRILIAIALIGEPRLLIADEPTTALDAITEKGIVDLLSRLGQELGMATVFITHDLKVMRQTADRIIVLENGKVKHQGSTTDILALSGAGLGLPANAAPPTETTTQDGESPADHTLRVENLSIAYPGRKPWPWKKAPDHVAVQDVSFSVAAGEWVALVGPSGCGKTSVARCLAGLLPAASGTVRLPRGKVQLVFQDPDSSLNPAHRVAEILEEVLRTWHPRQSRSFYHARIGQLLAQVDLPAGTYALRRPSQLSGGQKQRVAIARALAADPSLLIADEAVSALDVPLRADVLDLFDHIRHAHRLGLLFISHDLGLVAERADRVIVMDGGRIVESGPPAQVLTQPSSSMGQRLVAAMR